MEFHFHKWTAWRSFTDGEDSGKLRHCEVCNAYRVKVRGYVTQRIRGCAKS